ncbi:methionine--tRNA ligase [Bacillus sp. BRMEA1]|uniref:methionine--tRNA ligase n=1 Tax=Neobacillus endophyticus TaxID=2738405 RepID=UPI001564666A|nr:methionine--tRNA ligase [Neobacillus endophyticus]NRD78924.1 methionine--tRNA ligase [Neobacillus endophyticus]
MSIFIGGAWPYANGSLHLGHISSLLPGDILAKYYRLQGEDVLYVSGSDCNGTPIAIRAKQEGISPKEVTDRYHKEFQDCFVKLGFTYDCYTRTDDEHHHKIVQDIFWDLLKKGLIYTKSVEQTYCGTCEQFLPDRYVEGICPHCGEPARGDQCDYCSAILDPVDLLNKTCKLCGTSPSIRNTEHFYFSLSSFQSELEQYCMKANSQKTWRDNAIQLTKRYLDEGLQDRAVSRDLPIGVSVPVKGYEEKKIYVWIEAVSGYYSASKQWANETGLDDSSFWSEQTKTYYVHGKDNIPFHTIIWPAILMGLGSNALPQYIVSNEYVTVEKKKLSTSRNWAVWMPDILEKYHPDSIRYFLTINAPENRDADFSWREFIYRHNSELLGAYGNFVHRTLKFIEKCCDGIIPDGELDPIMWEQLLQIYNVVGKQIEAGHFKAALAEVFNIIRAANKFFDDEQPWKQFHENKSSCKNTLFTCAVIIANLAQLLSPFLPFSSGEVQEILRLTNLSWKPIQIDGGLQIKEVSPLFERIDVKRIDEELEQLAKQAN